MRRRVAAKVTALLLTACAAVCLFAACAFNPSYHVENVRIDAQVQTDASVHLVDHRLLAMPAAPAVKSSTSNSADGGSAAAAGDSASADDASQAQTDESAAQTQPSSKMMAVEYRQTYPHLADNQAIVINDARVAYANDKGVVEGDWTWLSPVEYQTEWGDAVPSSLVEEFAKEASCTFDPESGHFYLFFQAPEDARVMIELDYTVLNGAQIYKDAGDVTFKYIDEAMATDSHDVTYTISLPVPEGEQATPRSNVYAWGHGPANGTFENFGPTIVYHVDLVRTGQYAEAHVMFPRSWLMNATGAESRIYRDELHATWTIKNEGDWHDAWRNASMNDDRISLVLVALCAAALLLAALVCMRLRKRPNPTDPIPADVLALAETVHPALEIRLDNEGKPSDGEFAATVVRLRDEKLLDVRRKDAAELSETNSASQNSIEFLANYCLVRTSYAFVENPLDSAAFQVLESLGLNDGISKDTLEERAFKNREAFLEAARAWENSVDEAYAAEGFMDKRNAAWATRLHVLSAVLIVLAIIVVAATSCYLASALLLVTGIATFVIASSLRGLSQRGIDVLAAIEQVVSANARASAIDESGSAISDEELARAVVASISLAFDAAQKPSSTVFTRMRDRFARLGRK